MKFRTTIRKRCSLFFTLVLTLYLLFFTQEMTPQVVQGTMIDENGDGLAEVNLELYINPFVYTTTSQIDGSFTFANVSGVEDEQLPTGYYVSNNFPNPFNPTTRIILTLPNGGNVRVAVFNVLGETVTEQIENYFNAGTNNIDLELNGLSNGFYFAKISIDDRYTVVKKMMLLYGSQHLSMGGSLLKYSQKKIMIAKDLF